MRAIAPDRGRDNSHSRRGRCKQGHQCTAAGITGSGRKTGWLEPGSGRGLGGEVSGEGDEAGLSGVGAGVHQLRPTGHIRLLHVMVKEVL